MTIGRRDLVATPNNVRFDGRDFGAFEDLSGEIAGRADIEWVWRDIKGGGMGLFSADQPPEPSGGSPSPLSRGICPPSRAVDTACSDPQKRRRRGSEFTIAGHVDLLVGIEAALCRQP